MLLHSTVPNRCLAAQQKVSSPLLSTKVHATGRSVNRSLLGAFSSRAATSDQRVAVWHPTSVIRSAIQVCRSSLVPDAIPSDVTLELDPDTSKREVTYDEDSKTVRIPLAAINDGQRRTKMVMFTCNKCGGRSARLVNPVAWEKGAVFAQCQHCDVWHTLAAAPHIIEEVRYNDPEKQQQQQQQQQQHTPPEAAATAAVKSETASEESAATAVQAEKQAGESEEVSSATAKQQGATTCNS
eukprot:gene3524-biopygen5224